MSASIPVPRGSAHTAAVRCSTSRAQTQPHDSSQQGSGAASESRDVPTAPKQRRRPSDDPHRARRLQRDHSGYQNWRLHGAATIFFDRDAKLSVCRSGGCRRLPGRTQLARTARTLPRPPAYGHMPFPSACLQLWSAARKMATIMCQNKSTAVGSASAFFSTVVQVQVCVPQDICF